MALTSSLRWPETGRIREALMQLAKQPLEEPGWSTDLEPHPGLDGRLKRSRKLADEAAELIAGGSHHTLIGNMPFPIFFDRSDGASIWDVDGNRYLDFVQAGGANLLAPTGRAEVAARVAEIVAMSGPALAMGHPDELGLAAAVRRQLPSMERLRMTASGTEAVLAAIRIARAFTGAAHLVKVGSAYHGWGDPVVYALRLPGTGGRGVHGIPSEVLARTHEVPPNDLEALRRTLAELAGTGGTAAVLLEPLGPQSGTWPVDLDYNARVAELCREFGALLIFDEVVSGFRLGRSGVQGFLGIEPDLTVLGKCLTGGFPAAGAVGGRADVMAVLGAGHASYALVAGTLTANPVSVAAGLAALTVMDTGDAAGIACRAGDLLTDGLRRIIEDLGLPFVTYNFGSIVHLHTSGVSHLSIQRPDFAVQAKARKQASDRFCAAALAEGLVLPVTGRMFTSAAHTDDIVDDALARFRRIFRRLPRQ